MSLEAEIQHLTGAMTRLAEGVEKLLSISQPSPAATPAPRKTNANVDGEKIEKLAAEVLDAVSKQLPPETPDPTEPSADATAPPTFDDAKRAFLAIAQKFGAVEGTRLSKDVLSRYGVPNLKALSAEQYGDFIERCDSVVAGGAA